MSRGFELVDYGETKIYEIPAFSRTGLVSHGFTARVGGRGIAPFESLNLAFHVGDDPGVVVANRQIVTRLLGSRIGDIVAAQQVHGVNIEVVTEDDAGRGAVSYDTAIPDTDGLVTNRPGLLLATFYADCVPIFILDPVQKVVALAHAGWKGTVGRIGALAVKKMTESFGTNPVDCLVGIGPSIGPCCYEVDEPVITRFRQEFAWPDQILENMDNGRARLNLWQANRNTMVEAGIKPNNVEIAMICTCCSCNTLFSYRGENGLTGRMGAFIKLKHGIE